MALLVQTTQTSIRPSTASSIRLLNGPRSGLISGKKQDGKISDLQKAKPGTPAGFGHFLISVILAILTGGYMEGDGGPQEQPPDGVVNLITRRFQGRSGIISPEKSSSGGFRKRCRVPSPYSTACGHRWCLALPKQRKDQQGLQSAIPHRPSIPTPQWNLSRCGSYLSTHRSAEGFLHANV